MKNMQHSSKFTVRPMNPSEANDVVDLICDCYGESYFYEEYYDPKVIIRLNENGYLRSVVAVTNQNEVIGHGALMKTINDPQIVEPVMAFVKPSFRKQGVLTQIAEYLYIERKPEWYQGVRGIYIPPVTKHTISQKEVYSHGFRDCGIWLGSLPDAEFKEIDTVSMQRITSVLTYLFVEEPTSIIIYPPKRHSNMITSLFKNLGVPFVECRVPEFFLKLNTISQLDIKEDKSLNKATIKIIQYGQNIFSEISAILTTLCIQKYVVIHLYLDLHNPSTYYLTPAFEKMGFFFAGIMPGTCCNDALILQYLHNNPIDFNKILLISDKAKEILAYIAANRNPALDDISR